MADKTYVSVLPFNVRETFENKHKASLPPLMKAAAEKAINSSSLLTTKKPSEKDAKGFALGGNLSLKKTAKGAEAKIEILLYYWPKESLFGNAKGSGAVEGGSDIDSAVEDLVTQVVEDAVKKRAAPELERRARSGDLN